MAEAPMGARHPAGSRALVRPKAGCDGRGEQLGETFVQAVQLVAGCTGRIFVTGSGTRAPWPTPGTPPGHVRMPAFSFLPAMPPR